VKAVKAVKAVTPRLSASVTYDAFMGALERRSRSDSGFDDAKAGPLLDLLLRNKKNLCLSFSEFEHDGHDGSSGHDGSGQVAYIVMVTCFKDRKLMALGKLPLAFPRGFCIVWDGADHVQMFGFLPKFDNDAGSFEPRLLASGCVNDAGSFEPRLLASGCVNDAASGPMDDDTVPPEVAGMHVNKKVSGYLGQLIAFQLPGDADRRIVRWTCCSKNSARSDTSPYVAEAIRMCEPLVTERVAAYLVNNRMHVCMEVMPA